MQSRRLIMSLGARAVRSMTAARARAGAFDRNETLSFLGPEPTGKAAKKPHVREKRKLSRRLREFFLYSPALGRTVGVRVLLPGRPQEVAPVLYLFHGGGDDFRSWTDLGRAEEITSDSDLLVVMPDAGAASYSTHLTSKGLLDWHAFHTEELPAFIDDAYSVSVEPRDQHLAGLSMGGYGAMKYAAMHPDRYGSAAAFSSPLNPRVSVPLFEIIGIRDGGTSRSLFGDLKRDSGVWAANSPYDLAANLRGVDLWFAAGSGDPDPMDENERVDVLEATVHHHGEMFHHRLDELGITHEWRPRQVGGHLWGAWQRDLAAWLGHRDNRAAGTDSGVRDGGTFSHISGQPVFSVHGWNVAISRRRAQLVEFADVDASGFSLNGAGTMRIGTPPLYQPGAKYRIQIEGPLAENVYETRADPQGRLDFTGRMGGALHDPIVPGKHTRHFRTWGQEEITNVRIVPVDAPLLDPVPAEPRRVDRDDETARSASRVRPA